MAYEMKPLGCDPKQLKGLSERLIVSHYENNYGGTVKRLNAITAQLAALDFATTPVFVSLTVRSAKAWGGTLEASIGGAPSSSPWARPWVAARVGCCSRIRTATASS